MQNKTWYNELFNIPQNRQKLEERLSLQEETDLPLQLEAMEDIFYIGSGQVNVTSEFFTLPSLTQYLHIAKGSILYLNEAMSTRFEIMYTVSGAGKATEIIMTANDLKNYLKQRWFKVIN